MVLQGPDKGQRYELPDAPALVGRDSKQLPLSDNTVSRRHCEIVPENGNWVIKDMGSANGTYVNGARVDKQYTLKLGDQIRVGRTLMVFGAQPGVSRASGGAGPCKRTVFRRPCDTTSRGRRERGAARGASAERRSAVARQSAGAKVSPVGPAGCFCRA